MLGRVPRLRPVLIFVRLSHDLAKSSPKIHRARVNNLLFGADRLLLTPRADTLESYIMTKLSDAQFYNAYRSTAFVRLIRFCLERHLFDVALALHARMHKEGFHLVHPLALRLSALRLVRDDKYTVSSLKPLFANEAYDVPAFTDLVHYLVDDPRVDDLARAFVSMRQIALSAHPDLVGLLARANMRSGRLDAAQAWLRVFEDTCGAEGVVPDVAPYADVMAALHEMQPANGEALHDVLVRMRAAGVAPDIHVFNALLRVHLVQRRYQEAFALYRVLTDQHQHQRGAALMPNDVTYKLLLRAVNVLDHPRLSRRCPPLENTVSPRRLFRDMLACHVAQTEGVLAGRSTAVSVSALHLALRTLMAREDYAAAYVVVCALPALGFRLNLQTYLIVVVQLVRRLTYEAKVARPDRAVRLVDVLASLGATEDQNQDPLETLVERVRLRRQCEGSSSERIGIDTVAHLLRLGAGAVPDDLPDVPSFPRLSTPCSRPRQGQRQRTRELERDARLSTPTVEMLMGAQDLSAATQYTQYFSPIPLARLVYKTLLGALIRKGAEREGWGWTSAERAAEAVVAETGMEMVPEGVRVNQGEEGAGENDGERGRGVLPFAAARMRRRRRGARGGREVLLDVEG